MAAPGKQSSSRWGSFLSQAVAGVESRLDNILADPEEARAKDGTGAPTAPTATTTTATTSSETTVTKQPQQPQQLAPPSKPSPGNSRSSSSSRVNDRLQARLAQAMAGKGTGSGPGSRGTTSPRSSVDQATRPSLDRQLTDKEAGEKQDTVASEPEPSGTDAPSIVEPPQESQSSSDDKTNEKTEPPETSVPDPSKTPVTGEEASAEVKESTEAAEARINEIPTSETTAENTPSPTPVGGDYLDLAKEIQAIKERQQEEVQEYVEQIDSLQSKLQYLSKTAAESAKKSASSAPSGSADKKLAEKDEKIALLMEEGQKLSSNEHKFRMTLRKLRAQIGDHDKQVEELKKNRDKALADAASLRNRLDGTEEDEKRKEEAKRATASLQKEIDALRKENSRKDESFKKLEQESKAKSEQAEKAHKEAMSKAIAAEKQKQKELTETISTLRVEKDAAVEKSRQDEIEWKEKLERAVERGRKVEEELQHEVQTMESKLEAMRTAAEEATSGSGGEAQVKMFRQIETLQSQYASARENWQGIESSLLAKAANLEKERDEAQRRESEMRKKARDATVKSRHLEDELQDIQPNLNSVRHDLEACRAELASLQAAHKSSQTALEEAQAELEKEKQRAASSEDSVEAERQQWVDDVAGATSKGRQSQPESPLLSVSRTFSSDMMGLPVPGKVRRSYTPGSANDGPGDVLSSLRRLSSQPPFRPGASSTAGSGPAPAPFSPFEPHSDPSALPSPPPIERENGVPEETIPPSSPRQVAQDMVSVSTVAAGPSVQLVERMSAAIRRLEGEKVAAKEEMARICSQRDEARGDMVGLMKELEEAKAASEKVPKLEEEVAALDSRYQTTLEMLGEKSELVEELKADVQDVKDMYRELVERTVK